MDPRPVLVIGATGHVGRHAVAALHAAGRPVRALSRRATPADFPSGVEAVAGDVADRSVLAEAASGAVAAFVVFPTLQADQHAPDVVRILADRVERLAYLSAEGADPTRLDDPGILGSHARMEQLVRDSGTDWTFLRSGGMATNTLAWAGQVQADGTVRWPFAAAARSLVHEADLGEVAAHVLTTPGHDRATYVLTGPHVLTHAEQAAAIGRAAAVDVTYVEVPRPEMRDVMVREWGLPGGVADEMLDAWQAMVGNRDGVTDTVERLLGRPARPFEAWARDHVADFVPAPA